MKKEKKCLNFSCYQDIYKKLLVFSEVLWPVIHPLDKHTHIHTINTESRL